MMDMEQIREWKAHPVTVEISRMVNDAVMQMQRKSKIRDTVDQTAIQTAYSEGFVEGVQSLNNALDDVIFQSKEESNVN
jgi:uncharacterized membrane protein YgcG